MGHDHADLSLAAVERLGLGTGTVHAVFDRQDSGCVSYGIEAEGRRWFVKIARTEHARRSLRNAVEFHRAVRHEAIVPLTAVLDDTDADVTLVYPWMAGDVLNRATVEGADRSTLRRFQRLPVREIEAAISSILAAHHRVAEAGFVAVDLYDGSLLYDFTGARMRLIDLDEYRPGPFVLEAERLPGSRRYMAPEELRRGATIDVRTNVYVLGRMIHHLLGSAATWRGTAQQAAVVERATMPSPEDRFETIDDLSAAWSSSRRSGNGRPT